MIALLQDYFHWWVQAIAVIIISAAGSFVAGFILRKIIRQSHKTKTFLDEVLLESALAPVKLFIQAIGAHVAIYIIESERHTTLLAFVALHFTSVYWVLLAWFISRFINRIEKKYLTLYQSGAQIKGDITTVTAITKISRIALLLVVVLYVLQEFGFNINSLLAAGGIGGLAVGLAARDLLANIFGGVMLYFEKPFKVGDWVRSPDRDIEGTVEEIGLRSTRILTFKSRPLYVPNSIFTTMTIENASRMTNRRIYEIIGLRYDDAPHIKSIVDAIEQMLRQHAAIDQQQTLMVNFNEFAQSSLNMFVYCFTLTTQWEEFHSVKQDVLFQMLSIIAAHDAQIAFPTSVIHVDTLLTQQQ